MSWFVDAHVHHHPSFDWREQIAAAFGNLRRWAAVAESEQPAVGVLAFVDLHGEPGLRELVAYSHGKLPVDHRLQPTKEPTSWRVVAPDGAILLLLAGRQIATREGLEVLALACDAAIADRLSLEDTIEASLARAQVTVIPWGFGKWWLGRGRIVERAWTRTRSGRVYLGDNGNRARGGPPPALFAASEEHGLPILAGSDPLPFASHVRRTLGYGFELDGALDVDRPGTALREALAALRRTPRIVGTRTPWPRFVRDQLHMQWLVRQRRTAARTGTGGIR